MCKRKIHRVVNDLQILYLALAHYHHLSIWWTFKANEKSLADTFLIGCFAWNVQFSRLNFSLALHLSYYVTGRHDGKKDTRLLVKLRLFLDFPFHSALYHIFLIHSFSSEDYNDHETRERSSQTNVGGFASHIHFSSPWNYPTLIPRLAWPSATTATAAELSLL